MTKINVVCPVGMSGLAVEPWSKGEIYAVAANWAQASSPVMVYGEDGWTNDECGRQVADFRHNDRAALKNIIERAIEASGDEVDDDEVERIVRKAANIESEVICPECGKVNVYADDDGYAEDFPREYHADCAVKMADDGRDPRG